MKTLRADLLAGRAVALGGDVRPELRARLAAVGAAVSDLDLAGAHDDDAVEAVRRCGRLDALVHDARASFGGGGQPALTRALEQSWRTIAAVAGAALIPARQGKVVLIAPSNEAGAHAGAARAALENLARTLSIEWARYGITTTAILPARTSDQDDVGDLVAFLLSAAGDYYSGCRFELV
jgi:NAD(P)-dependent dehydrogenase (short-subunit alcohol dehydrogenase family)